MFDLRQLERAQDIVAAAMPPTPAHQWPLLSERLGATAIVKHENHTPTGAFKVRGGLVYVDRLKRERPHTAGLISSSTAKIFRPPARRPDAAPSLMGWNSCRPSIRIWFSASRPMRLNSCGRRRTLTSSMFRSDRDRASAAASWRAICLG